MTHKGNQRLVSLDALRGFDMFWIIGATGLAGGLKALHIPGADFLASQLTHSGWNGFRFYDLIFPLFIFIMGISTALSLERRLEKGESVPVILRHVLARTVILFLLGIFYNGGVKASPLWANLRLMGVLQRIALCYLITSFLVLTIRRRHLQIYLTAGILIGYWALMRFVPVPGYGAGFWRPVGNLAQFVDYSIIPGKLYFGTWDPEGLFSTIPAVATCLIGVLTGYWLRKERRHKGHILSPGRKNIHLLFSGFGLSVAGLLFGIFFPINKSLWTSSFVLLTGGIGVVLMAVFHWVIDIKGYKKWAFPFVVIGMNSLFIYLIVNILPFAEITRRMVGGDVSLGLGNGRKLFDAAGQLVIEWLLLFSMYKRKIYIKL